MCLFWTLQWKFHLIILRFFKYQEFLNWPKALFRHHHTRITPSTIQVYIKTLTNRILCLSRAGTEALRKVASGEWGLSNALRSGSIRSGPIAGAPLGAFCWGAAVVKTKVWRTEWERPRATDPHPLWGDCQSVWVQFPHFHIDLRVRGLRGDWTQGLTPG